MNVLQRSRMVELFSPVRHSIPLVIPLLPLGAPYQSLTHSRHKAFHSNTERAYLGQVMAPRLLNEMDRLWSGGRHEIQPATAFEATILLDHSVSVQISKRDRDPFQIIEV